MTGVVHIVVAVKPSDANLADNALSEGVAGLWIDGGRLPIAGEKIPYSKMAPYSDERTWMTSRTPAVKRGQHPLGRWPANVVLGHSSSCKRADSDGVEAWECADGCLIGVLDKQAIESGLSGQKDAKQKARDARALKASRFFKQVSSDS